MDQLAGWDGRLVGATIYPCAGRAQALGAVLCLDADAVHGDGGPGFKAATRAVGCAGGKRFAALLICARAGA